MQDSPRSSSVPLGRAAGGALTSAAASSAAGDAVASGGVPRDLPLDASSTGLIAPEKLDADSFFEALGGDSDSHSDSFSDVLAAAESPLSAEAVSDAEIDQDVGLPVAPAALFFSGRGARGKMGWGDSGPSLFVQLSEL